MKTMHLIYALPMILIVSQAAIHILGILRMRAAAPNITVIRSRSDLDQVRNAIQTNLFFGIAIVGNGVLMAGTIWWAIIISGEMKLMLFYIAALAGTQIVLWKTCRPVEQRFKSLPVESEDASLLPEYKYYVEQWKGFCIFLKSPKNAGQKEPSSK